MIYPRSHNAYRRIPDKTAPESGRQDTFIDFQAVLKTDGGGMVSKLQNDIDLHAVTAVFQFVLQSLIDYQSSCVLRRIRNDPRLISGCA